MAYNEFEKFWVCRSCLHKFVPFRNSTTCPKCKKNTTFRTNEDSLIKKSETHAERFPEDPILIISEKSVIENRDIEDIYERRLSWLRDYGAEITLESKPFYLYGKHSRISAYIVDWIKSIRIKLSSVDNGVRLEVDIWRLVDPRKPGQIPYYIRVHKGRLRTVVRYRKSWKTLYDDLINHLGIKQDDTDRE